MTAGGKRGQEKNSKWEQIRCVCTLFDKRKLSVQTAFNEKKDRNRKNIQAVADQTSWHIQMSHKNISKNNHLDLYKIRHLPAVGVYYFVAVQFAAAWITPVADIATFVAPYVH